MKYKKKLGLMLGLAMMATLLASCQNANQENAVSQEDSISGSDDLEHNMLQHMEISVSIWGIQEGFDNSNAVNDTIFNELQDKFNITIIPMGVTWNDYQEKNRIWAASDSLPDVFADNLALDNSALYRTWAAQGIIKEIPQNLSDYTNLEMVMDSEPVRAVAIDGKQYMIPRGGDPSGIKIGASKNGMSRPIMYRKDWAKEAGYEEAPKTFEEMVEMIQAMMANHPGAVGIVANNSDYLATLGLEIIPEYSNINSWVYEGEQWIPCYASERVVLYLERMQKLYADGILDPDFMTQKDGDAIAKFMNGYACVSLGGQITPQIFMAANPDVENFEDAFGFILPFAAEDGNHYMFTGTSFWWSETYISANVDDAKLERILMLLDYMYSEEYMSRVMNGIEGVDWEEQGGEKVSLQSEGESGGDKYPITAALGWLASWGYGDTIISSNPSEAAYTRLEKEAKKYEEENMQAAPINFQILLMDNEEKAAISSLGTAFVERANQIIISREDARTAWEKLIAEFDERGLQEAIASVTTQAAEEGIQP